MSSIINYQNSMTVYYNKNTGNITNIMGGIQNLNIFGDKKNELSEYINYIVLKKNIEHLRNSKYYKVDLINNQLTKRSQQEIDEIQQYGKLLTDSERTLNKLKPSHEEIQKAQNTIEILTLIQEVIQ